MASDDYSEEALFRRGVLQLALDLRMSANGSGDHLGEDHERAVVDYLEKRLRAWRPSTSFGQRFDEAVRTLVERALAEHEWHRRLRRHG